MRDRRGERSRRLCRHCAVAGSTRTDDRRQFSLTVVETVVTTLFALVVAAGPALALLTSTAGSDALARQATDAASLVRPVPAEGPGTFLGVACGLSTEFDDRAAWPHEVVAAGPSNGVFVSLRTEVGSVGRPPPETTRVRTTTAVVLHCTVTLEVRYP